MQAEPATPFALLLLDVDRFKLFNEAHGPSLGDEVLRTLARGLMAAVGERAEVMRLGEDEFALLAVDPDPEARARLLGGIVRELTASRSRRPNIGSSSTCRSASRCIRRPRADRTPCCAPRTPRCTWPSARRARRAVRRGALRTLGSGAALEVERRCAPVG